MNWMSKIEDCLKICQVKRACEKEQSKTQPNVNLISRFKFQYHHRQAPYFTVQCTQNINSITVFLLGYILRNINMNYYSSR